MISLHTPHDRLSKAVLSQNNTEHNGAIRKQTHSAPQNNAIKSIFESWATHWRLGQGLELLGEELN